MARARTKYDNDGAVNNWLCFLCILYEEGFNNPVFTFVTMLFTFAFCLLLGKIGSDWYSTAGASFLQIDCMAAQTILTSNFDFVFPTGTL